MNKDRIKMPYGKFKNQYIDKMPSGYLKWIAENWSENNARNKVIIKAADNEWQYREKYNCHID